MKRTPLANRRTKAATPLPGQPVRGSRTGRPVMALLDLLGRRWTLRVVWELRDGRARTFRALQASLDDVSPTILNTRLKELREARLVELREDGYALTVLGTELLKLLLPVARLAEDWAEHQRRR